MPVSKKLAREIKEATILGIRRNGDRIFSLSQQKCPVDFGTLLKSGYVNPLSDGVEIGYKVPYAAAVHSGVEEKSITGNQVVHIQGTSKRKAHDRVYKNKRLVPIGQNGRTIFRVIDKIARKEGRPFLMDAVKEGLPYLPEDIKFAFRQLGLGKVG